MTSPIVIDGKKYEHLGNNQLLDLQTQNVIDANQVFGKNIHLGSGNDQRGLRINSHTVTISPCSCLVSEILLKLIFALGAVLVVSGSVTLAMEVLPLGASISMIAIGIVAILGVLYRCYGIQSS